MTPREVSDCTELLTVKFPFESMDKKEARRLFRTLRWMPPMVEVNRAHWIYRLLYRYSLQIQKAHPEEWWRYVERHMFKPSAARAVKRQAKVDYLARKAAGTLKPEGRPRKGKPLWRVFAEKEARE